MSSCTGVDKSSYAWLQIAKIIVFPAALQVYLNQHGLTRFDDLTSSFFVGQVRYNLSYKYRGELVMRCHYAARTRLTRFQILKQSEKINPSFLNALALRCFEFLGLICTWQYFVSNWSNTRDVNILGNVCCMCSGAFLGRILCTTSSVFRLTRSFLCSQLVRGRRRRRSAFDFVRYIGRPGVGIASLFHPSAMLKKGLLSCWSQGRTSPEQRYTMRFAVW